jgi:hypothetical protein
MELKCNYEIAIYYACKQSYKNHSHEHSLALHDNLFHIGSVTLTLLCYSFILYCFERSGHQPASDCPIDVNHDKLTLAGAIAPAALPCES